jgi:hypothetical protein
LLVKGPRKRVRESEREREREKEKESEDLKSNEKEKRFRQTFAPWAAAATGMGGKAGLSHVIL